MLAKAAITSIRLVVRVPRAIPIVTDVDFSIIAIPRIEIMSEKVRNPKAITPVVIVMVLMECLYRKAIVIPVNPMIVPSTTAIVLSTSKAYWLETPSCRVLEITMDRKMAATTRTPAKIAPTFLGDNSTMCSSFSVHAF